MGRSLIAILCASLASDCRAHVVRQTNTLLIAAAAAPELLVSSNRVLDTYVPHPAAVYLDRYRSSAARSPPQTRRTEIKFRLWFWLGNCVAGEARRSEDDSYRRCLSHRITVSQPVHLVMWPSRRLARSLLVIRLCAHGAGRRRRRSFHGRTPPQMTFTVCCCLPRRQHSLRRI